MKSTLIFAACLALLATVSRYGLPGLVVLFAMLALITGLYFALRRYIRHLRALRHYGRLTEPVIILAQYPGDPGLYRKAKHHEKYIKLSGNKNHIVGVDEQGNEIKEPVKVHAIYENFPAENYGETWEEYQARAHEERLRILRSFHSYLYNKGRHEWYLDRVLKQNMN